MRIESPEPPDIARAKKGRNVVAPPRSFSASASVTKHPQAHVGRREYDKRRVPRRGREPRGKRLRCSVALRNGRHLERARAARTPSVLVRVGSTAPCSHPWPFERREKTHELRELRFSLKEGMGQKDGTKKRENEKTAESRKKSVVLRKKKRREKDREPGPFEGGFVALPQREGSGQTRRSVRNLAFNRLSEWPQST